MSRQAKAFFGASVAVSAATIWGVHYIQQRESDTMYQGVLKDEERVRLKALTKSQAITTSPPLNTPSAPVQQPAAVIDEDCVTCAISPPPELVESQSKEQRASERAERMAEYEAQKGLARKLGEKQGVTESRLV